MKKQQKGNAIRPDAQAFDEVRIVTVPRFKTSWMSGDEWRISARIDLLRDGTVQHSESFGDVEHAARFLPYVIAMASDDGKGWFASEGDHCDQEGCADIAESVLRVKQSFCVGGGNCGQKVRSFGEKRRQFCARHVRRGDCDLEDNDANYEVVSGPGLATARRVPGDESPSVFGGVLAVDPLPQEEP